MVSQYISISYRYEYCYDKAVEDALSEYGIDKNTGKQLSNERHLVMKSCIDHKRSEVIDAFYRDGCFLFFLKRECPYLLNGKMHADFCLLNQFNECIKRFSYDL